MLQEGEQAVVLMKNPWKKSTMVSLLYKCRDFSASGSVAVANGSRVGERQGLQGELVFLIRTTDNSWKEKTPQMLLGLSESFSFSFFSSYISWFNKSYSPCCKPCCKELVLCMRFVC